MPCRSWPPACSATARARPARHTSADAAIASIRQAVADVSAGRASAVVTNPIAKSVLYRAGFRHPGHTEFLAELAASGGHTPQPVMMLWSPALAVVPVTIHVSLRDAISQLSSELIVDDRAHRGRGSANPVRPHQSAARGIRAQSARRRRRLARHRGPDHRGAGRRNPARRRHRRHADRCRPTPCSMKPRARPMTARSACITIRR